MLSDWQKHLPTNLHIPILYPLFLFFHRGENEIKVQNSISQVFKLACLLSFSLIIVASSSNNYNNFFLSTFGPWIHLAFLYLVNVCSLLLKHQRVNYTQCVYSNFYVLQRCVCRCHSSPRLGGGVGPQTLIFNLNLHSLCTSPYILTSYIRATKVQAPKTSFFIVVTPPYSQLWDACCTWKWLHCEYQKHTGWCWDVLQM